MKIVLASASPRRHELLLQAGIEHEVRPTDCDESETAYRAGEAGAAEAYVMELARRKGEAYHLRAGETVLSADTVVYLPRTREILGKPHTRAHAIEMLESLSGRVHMVITGVCLRDSGGIFAHFADVTEVEFYPLPRAEIERYVDTARPFDKAGAYGIQELACRFVRCIRGDYANVVGLPVGRIYWEIRRREGDGGDEGNGRF